VGGIDKLDHLPRFLRSLAEVVGQPCNYTQLGGQTGLDSKTAARYMGVFEQLYLLQRVEVWAKNRLKRVSKMPKLQFIDSGLLATLIDLSRAEVERDRRRFGSVLETFVFSELLKHSTTCDDHRRLLHYRDLDGFEVDVVIENAAGYLVGVEVKASATVTARDLRGLKKLSTVAGDRFKMGVILYDGTEILPLGHGIWAAPISTLWGI
jgi:predicted AAA+ superfamily ATPase